MCRKPLGGALPGYRRSPLPLHAKPFDLLCRRENWWGKCLLCYKGPSSGFPEYASRFRPRQQHFHLCPPGFGGRLYWGGNV